MKRIAFLVAGVLALGGCAAAQVQVVPTAAPVSVVAANDREYAAALAEAFEAYEHEVEVAASLTFGSEAEAFAVMQTLSEARIDWQLRQALMRHGLRMVDLEHYAETHPAFFDQQQRLYSGRLDQIQASVASLAQHVAQIDNNLLASD